MREKGQFHRYVGSMKPERMLSLLGTDDVPGKSGNKERERIDWRGESLDAMHEWHGDTLPDELWPLESKPFTDSLAKAVRHLEVNTQEGYSEAGVSVSIIDNHWGSEIKEGTLGRVAVPEPRGRDGRVEDFAKLHTHSTDEGPSPTDWANFLSNEHYRQMCIVTPSFTLTFYKPPGRQHSNDRSEEAVLEKTSLMSDRYLLSGGWAEEDSLREKVYPFVNFDPLTRQICENYGILYRTGVRSKTVGGNDGKSL